MHTKGKLHSLHCFSRNTDSFKLLIYSESQATTVHFEVQSTSPSPSVHLTTLHRVVTFFQEDWALKASDSQSTERKRKKSQHTQLIIHDAFKACAAALCRYGNWGAQLTYNGGIPHLAVTQCAERKKKSKKKKSLRLQWQKRTTMGQKSIFDWLRIWWRCHVWQETMHVCKCVFKYRHAHVWSQASILYICCINLAVLILLFVLLAFCLSVNCWYSKLHWLLLICCISRPSRIHMRVFSPSCVP